MATPTYDLLDSVTLSSSASSVSFSGISQSYRDLVLMLDGATNATTSVLLQLRFNGDSTGSYSYVYMEGNGSTAASSSASGQPQIYSGRTWGYQNETGSAIINIMDYSATDKHKSVLLRQNTLAPSAAYTLVSQVAGRWANTSAITSVEIRSNNAYAAGLTAYLYGVAA